MTNEYDKCSYVKSIGTVYKSDKMPIRFTYPLQTNGKLFVITNVRKRRLLEIQRAMHIVRCLDQYSNV